MAKISVPELKKYLNIVEDNADYDAKLLHLIEAAKEDLLISTGKNIDNENNAITRQYIKLYAYREFNAVTYTAVDNRLCNIKKMILHSVRFSEAE